MNLFWNIYKNLENELIALSNNIFFCDEQDLVYSIHISDLLIRTAVEIEAISKELYKLAGGNMSPVDADGKQRDLFFDSDCIQFLDINWKITKKIVNVVSSNFFFMKEENLVLRPLKDCNKQGKGRWKKAYQAVKHDRVGSIASGNIANLIRAMAALYILNIYYRNERYDAGTIMSSIPFDNRLGSGVFSVTLAHAEKCLFDEKMSDLSIDSTVRNLLDGAVIIQKYTEASFRDMHRAMIVYNHEAKERLIKEPAVISFLTSNPDYKFKTLLSLAIDAGGEDLANRMLRGQKVIDCLPKSYLEVVLNKGQQIYPELGNS